MQPYIQSFSFLAVSTDSTSVRPRHHGYLEEAQPQTYVLLKTSSHSLTSFFIGETLTSVAPPDSGMKAAVSCNRMLIPAVKTYRGTASWTKTITLQ